MNVDILLEGYKEYKGLIDTSSDNKLKPLLRSVIAYINHSFNIVVLPLEATYRVIGTNRFVIDKTPIEKVKEIRYDDPQVIINENNDPNGILTSLIIENNEIILEESLYDGIIEFDLILGYENVPDDLLLVIYILTDVFYEGAENNINIMNSFQDPVGGRASFRKTIPKDVYRLLSPYILYNY